MLEILKLHVLPQVGREINALYAIVPIYTAAARSNQRVHVHECIKDLTLSRECLLNKTAGDVKYTCSFTKKSHGRAVGTITNSAHCAYTCIMDHPW